MSAYAFWNNKGGVGKSYLTFQVASEYAKTHPDKPVLVIDLCPQANASGMLLGGIVDGERRPSRLRVIPAAGPSRTILKSAYEVLIRVPKLAQITWSMFTE